MAFNMCEKSSLPRRGETAGGSASPSSFKGVSLDKISSGFERLRGTVDFRLGDLYSLVSSNFARRSLAGVCKLCSELITSSGTVVHVGPTSSSF